MEHNVWAEYDRIALDMAQRGLKGEDGDALPDGISGEVYWLIFEDNDAFQERVRMSAYWLAMGGD